MALHDLVCRRCGQVHQDVNIPVTVGARAYCRVTPCSQPLYQYDLRESTPLTTVYTNRPCGGTLEPIPAIRLSLLSDGESKGGFSDFAKFSLPVEDPGAPGGFRQETIGSLRDIRRLEKESEQRERDGLGRRMIWRDYSQDVSNRDQHTLGEDPSLRPAKTFLNGQPVLTRRGDPVVEAHGVPPEFQEQP